MKLLTAPAASAVTATCPAAAGASQRESLSTQAAAAIDAYLRLGKRTRA